MLKKTLMGLCILTTITNYCSQEVIPPATANFNYQIDPTISLEHVVFEFKPNCDSEKATHIRPSHYREGIKVPTGLVVSILFTNKDGVVIGEADPFKVTDALNNLLTKINPDRAYFVKARISARGLKRILEGN